VLFRSLRRELYKGLQRAARPAKDAAREGASRLPQRGGLAARVAGARFSVRATAGRNPRVRITATEAGRGKVNLASLDRGRLRHPLFGDRGHWFSQAVPPQWFSGPIAARADAVRAELEQAVTAVERFISGR
jgi:hypothetical protein